MSTQELTAEAMALPLPDRVSLAQALWESIEAGLSDTDVGSAVREAIRRDEELSSGAATGRTHEEVMQPARRSTRMRVFTASIRTSAYAPTISKVRAVWISRERAGEQL